MKLRASPAFGTVILGLLISPQAHADFTITNGPPGTVGCTQTSSGTFCPQPSYTPQPSGPTPEQLDAKDLREATQYALDKGYKALKEGDFDEAVRRFREALKYSPGDPDIQAALSRAERQASLAREARLRRAREGETVRQLTSAAEYSNAAKPGADKSRAGMVFDTDGGRGRGLQGGAVYAGAAANASAPVVPPSKRTPAIAALERQLTGYDKEMAALDNKLRKLDPSRDAVEIVRVKQQKSTVESKKRFVTFKINEALKTPEPTPSIK
jgi:hypothetical protein